MVEYALAHDVHRLCRRRRLERDADRPGQRVQRLQRLRSGISGNRPIRWEAARERHRDAVDRRVRARGRGLLVRRAHAAHPQLADVPGGGARPGRGHAWRTADMAPSRAPAGFLVGLALFFPLFALKGLGAGDVKLMGALGAWLGTSLVFGVAFYTTLAGGVLALGLIARHRYARPGRPQPLAAAHALARLRPQAARLADARDLRGSEASLRAADCGRRGADVLAMVKQTIFVAVVPSAAPS